MMDRTDNEYRHEANLPEIISPCKLRYQSCGCGPILQTKCLEQAHRHQATLSTHHPPTNQPSNQPTNQPANLPGATSQPTNLKSPTQLLDTADPSGLVFSVSPGAECGLNHGIAMRFCNVYIVPRNGSENLYEIDDSLDWLMGKST